MLTEKLPTALTSQFEPALLAELDQFASIRTVEPGDILMESGLPIRYVPIVLDGSIKILRPGTDPDEGEMLLYYLNTSDSCALSFNSLLTGQLSQIRAVVEEKAQVLMIPAEAADDWMSRYPRWRAFVFQTYQKRFDSLLETLDSVAFRQMDERLLSYLHRRTALTGSHTLYTTHEEIARDLNTSREVISRLLRQLEKQQQVRLSRNKITLNSPV